MKTTKKNYLFGASLIALSSIITWSGAQAQCAGQQTRSYYCQDYKGNSVADSHCNPAIYPGLSAAAVTALGNSKPANQTLSCNSAPCPPPPPVYSGDGGDGGDGGYSDNDGDGQGDSPTADGGPHGSTDGTGGSGDGGGDGSVLCGHFYERKILGYEIYIGDLEFSENHVEEATKRGYRLWAVPLTKYLNANPGGFVEKAAKPFVVGWATEMAYRTGHTPKGHWLGKVQLAIAKPVVNFIGLFVEDTEWHDLKSEKEIKKEHVTPMAGTPLSSYIIEL